MKLSRDGSYNLSQTGFDVGVYVFQSVVQLQPAVPRLAVDLLQASFDLGSLGRRNDALSGQHAAVCDASKDVLFNQPTVKIDRLSEVLHKLIGPSREASAPLSRH